MESVPALSADGDVILTGIARSGTTLACNLLNRLPDTVSLHEPMSLAVLLSWKTTLTNWNEDRQPAAEAFDDDLHSSLDAEPDALGRQLAMLAWSFRQYGRHLAPEAVIRYEDVVATAGRALRPQRESDLRTRRCPGHRRAAAGHGGPLLGLLQS